MADTSSIDQILSQNGYSVTTARQAVFNALLDSGPITMSQLTNKVGNKINRASVYRTVSLFEKLGIINRLQMGWKYKLELGDIFTEHHHHMTCIQCGTVISFEEDSGLESGIEHAAAQASFKISSHSLEIRGLCHTCYTIA